MTEPLLRVVKLGGSLLDLAGLAAALRRWVSTQPPADQVIVVGGGAVVDSIRQADALHALGEEASHWLALGAMDLTARLVSVMLPEAPLLEWLDKDSPRQAGRVRIVLPCAMLRELDARTELAPLPHCWDVTSDSIAAWLAGLWRADELVLLKSRLPTGGSAADNELLDPYFCRVAASIPSIRCVNLRDAAFADCRI
jgi:aspartokinase-like uncharacterized kinase